MLKRRPRVARARLPAVPPAAPGAGDSDGRRPADDAAPWPDPPAALRELWLCLGTTAAGDATAALARLALRYTPVVSVEPGRGVLLEVAASLRLFGGLEALRHSLCSTLRSDWPSAYGDADTPPADKSLAAGVILACAPTPRAAVWLSHEHANAGGTRCCNTRADVRRAFGHLPLTVAGWPDKVQRQLRQMGLRTLGDCLRLPRVGFARRVGRHCLQQLDEALGERPQLLTRYVAPECFRAHCELPDDTTDSALLLAALEPLFERLERFLRRRQSGVSTVEVQLSHHDQQPTVLHLGMARPCGQRKRWLPLARLQLERAALPAPVDAVALRAWPVALSAEPEAGLPGIKPGGQTVDDCGLPVLIDTLRARLGAAGVYALQAAAEHRPECAWQIAEPFAGGREPASHGVAGAPKRPLWLLDRPRPVTLAPALVAALCAGGAERIESGWWDGHDIRRDYYRITTPDGSCWWVYQCRRSTGWYLHGLFG